jgi:CUG-BP- and ETR3-like factor
MYGPLGGGGGGSMRGAPMSPYGQYFPASSPGPPIQTTTSNKGPDGANLFIFHIPNHFTNLDMYQLFVPYGNLLSVRIMVEKETGRSRGFGFVSYDNPDSAALAIKELNGFPVGYCEMYRRISSLEIRSKNLLPVVIF